MTEFKKINSAANKGPAALLNGDSRMNPFTAEGKEAISSLAFSELLADQKTFDWEISYQMKLKANDKLTMEKRSKSDFVKPARSENILYRNQVESLDDTIRILEKDNEWLLNAGETK